MATVIETACFDMNIVNIHKQFLVSGKTKEDCWEYCGSKFNLMQLGIPAYDMIDDIWSNK